jgi:cytochrome c oxidase subunit 3
VISEVVSTQRKKIHPYKFTLWVAMASILMMFAGMTSAYLVKGSLPGWTELKMPGLFYLSTAVIICSSITVQGALQSFRKGPVRTYRNWLAGTVLLGMAFVVMQTTAFYQMYQSGIRLEGAGAAQFLYIIFGLHALHVLGGLVALLTQFFKLFRNQVRSYDPVPLEITATYWHFVDVLWIYLFVFFLLKL